MKYFDHLISFHILVFNFKIIELIFLTHPSPIFLILVHEFYILDFKFRKDELISRSYVINFVKLIESLKFCNFFSLLFFFLI